MTARSARVAMPHLHIRTINSAFDVLDEGRDYDNIGLARTAARKGAVAIAGDEMSAGKAVSIIEIRIEESGETVDRFVVAASTASMMPGSED